MQRLLTWLPAILLAGLALPSRGAGEIFVDSGIELGGQKAAWADFDNDGLVDVIAGGKVYRNDGEGFSEFSSVGQGIWGDFDNDGWLDIFAYDSRSLLRNDRGQRFVNITRDAIPELPIEVSVGAAWADFDGDSFLDLYVGGFESPGYNSDVILMNEGGETFRLAWVQEGDIDPARGITACDFDEDGDMDVYVSNYRLEQNQLWRNDGTGTFTNAGPSHGVLGIYDGWDYSYGHTIGSAWGDLDNDGHFDLFVANFSHPPEWQDRSRFYRNLGPGADYRFADLSDGAGLAWQESFASPALGDVDNDGDLDLYLTTVYRGDRNVLYLNDGNFSFTELGNAGLPQGATYQAAWADFDNDGDLDLATNGRLLRNKGNSNDWLKLRLRGDGIRVNTAAIGAQVRAFVGGRILTRQVESATGEGNQNDLTLHFGLGRFDGDRVPIEIRWPDGTVDTREVSPNQTAEIIYGSPPFLRGDSNADARVDTADAVFSLTYLFASGPSPPCLDAADANDDGTIDLSDPVAILRHLFAFAGDLPEPFGVCGIDPTADELDCAEYDSCR